MAYFPIFIEIEKQKCLVIGGGKVALRKIETLLRYGAQVQVISREVCEEISGLLSPECIRLGEPEEADMSGAVLVIAATGSRQVNHRAGGVQLFLSGSGEKGRYQRRHQYRREKPLGIQSGAPGY